MSGGHFDYDQYKISQIIETLKTSISNLDNPEYAEGFENAELLRREFNTGLIYLELAFVYAQRIDWLLSGDDGEESFHCRLQENLSQLKQQYNLENV
jgi:hypothetical protein